MTKERPGHGRAHDFHPALLESEHDVFLGWLALFTMMALVFTILVELAEPVDLVTIDPARHDFYRYEPPRIREIVEPPPLPVAIPSKPVERVLEGARPHRERNSAPARPSSEVDVVERSALLQRILGTHGPVEGDRTTRVFDEEDAVGATLEDALRGVGTDALTAHGDDAFRAGGEGRDDAQIGELARGGGGEGRVATAIRSRRVESRVDSLPVRGEGAPRVEDAIRAYGGQIRYCYETQLRSSPPFEGRLVLELDIRGGRVTHAAIVENATENEALEACVLDKVRRRWVFPAEVEAIGVTVPYVLTAK